MQYPLSIISAASAVLVLEVRAIHYMRLYSKNVLKRCTDITRYPMHDKL